jgi:predicted transcriptional regulator
LKLINLKEIVRASGSKNTEIASDLGISEKAVSEWINGKKFPNDKSLSYLIGKFGELQAESDEGLIVSLKPEMR